MIHKKRERVTQVFEVGKFYAHEGGRQIAVLGTVNTFKWGESFVIEEADATGHGVSVAEVNKFADIQALGWIEIGQEEWLRNFDTPSCALCGKTFDEETVKHAKVVATDRGIACATCFKQMVDGMPPSIHKPGGSDPIIIH